MKLSTVELLVDEKIIKLIEYTKVEKDNNPNIVMDKKTGKYYKYEETEDEIKMEILAKCLKYISTIKSILVALLILFVLFSIITLIKLTRLPYM